MEIQSSAVLITGGTRGLGRALASELAQRGARVVLVARDAGAVEQAVAELRVRHADVYGIAADIGDKAAIHRIAAEAAAWVGPIDLLILNASSLGPTPLRLWLDTECEDLERVLAVNLVGPTRLTRALAGSMVLRRRGVIVHVSSDAAVNAYPTWGAYGASKAALDHVSRTLAAELEGQGVRVLSIDPGEMDTQMHRDALPDADPTTLASPSDVARRIVALIADANVMSGARVTA